MKRGQLFSLDFLSAVFIFLMIFVILLVYWGSFLDNISQYSERKDMEIYANRISNFLVSGNGQPRNWENDTAHVITIGLVDIDRTIDNNKLSAFIGMNYDDIREDFWISGYHFCFRLVYSGIEKCDFGAGDADAIVTYSSRAVSYNGKNDILEVHIWRYI